MRCHILVDAADQEVPRNPSTARRGSRTSSPGRTPRSATSDSRRTAARPAPLEEGDEHAERGPGREACSSPPPSAGSTMLRKTAASSRNGNNTTTPMKSGSLLESTAGEVGKDRRLAADENLRAATPHARRDHGVAQAGEQRAGRCRLWRADRVDVGKHDRSFPSREPGRVTAGVAAATPLMFAPPA